MKEIGGYIELDTYSLPLLHENAIALNCGRNALAYLIQSKKIKKILLPKFLCKSVQDVCLRENVEISYYSIDKDLLPCEISLYDNEWLYIVNYYGQLTNETIEKLKTKYKNVIVDNAQSYFQLPVENVDTLYTCRKYFGVADGAFLYTNVKLCGYLQQDESFSRMNYILGRYERNANDFYLEYTKNNHFFKNEPIKRMSKLTNNLLRGINYANVHNQRVENFSYLHNFFKENNNLSLKVIGTFMYPLLVDNGDKIRRELQTKKIYIPTLWPDVFECCDESDFEYMLAKNILPLPIDQRYTIEDMKYLAENVLIAINQIKKEEV